VDASVPRLERARALGGGEFRVLTYDALTADPRLAGDAFDIVVLNFALLGEDVSALLRALGALLKPGGVVLIQTVHPWAAAGEEPYADGWRLETFAAFGATFPASMPWYFRTLETWFSELTAAGLDVVALAEPRHPETARPLSMVFTCAHTGRAER
jgi:SAM-dependent methyltransferase